MARDTYFVLTAKDTVPKSTSGSGTISTNGVNVVSQYITGSGTSFQTESERGAWIWDTDNDELRKVKEVISDTELVVFGSFTNEFSAISLKYISKDDAQIIFMEVDNTGGSATTIDGVALGSAKVFTDGQPDNNSVARLCLPRVVDGATSNCTVTLTYNRNA